MIRSKWIMSITVMVIFSVILAGCGTAASSKAKLVEGKVNVVTSFYPLYEFTKAIGGEYVNAINLVPAGVEPHDWSPKSRDIKNMTQAQIFVYQGAGFEGWVKDFLGSLSPDSTLKVVEASNGANLIRTSENKEEFDPHAWLSPLNAVKMANNIKTALISADPAHKDAFEQNYASYAAKLTDLDARYKKELGQTSKKEIAVSHQAFAYLCRDYGLTQLSIMGLSPDAEPTAQDLKNMNEYIKVHNLKYIFFEELVSDKLAKTLAKDAKVETMVLNPLEGLTKEQADAGEDYISIMDKNLKNLVTALQ
ncbi:metal ABC transporter substrate-binding protein [Paenibacillus chondroitinus]|uniref:Metal ABC transporter substrate-binding protein n=1 Tax=Paenibacillus chondroitinus TaxID=59842 RepID=A0ABU6DMB1_9BACL|nr:MULTISPECIES: metal ABC transporter substrate-binding protein [Paenibacillus]MCY9656978.1 metal ABC transporter substrate-binding protein [Paenibacillus anseongense]MEB4798774.1 metal ABC transporter substrate-binding protein [Paenibacillus chondroitinus]